MYKYEDFRERIFTDEGQRLFLSIRDGARKLFESSDMVTMQQIIDTAYTPDPWKRLACVDRLLELGEITEIQQSGDVAAQNRIFKGRFK